MKVIELKLGRNRRDICAAELESLFAENITQKEIARRLKMDKSYLSARNTKIMKTVSIPTNKNLYVLKTNDHYWLTTLATNKSDCFALAKPYCKTDDHKKELKKDGYECVRIHIVERTQKHRPVELMQARSRGLRRRFLDDFRKKEKNYE